MMIVETEAAQRYTNTGRRTYRRSRFDIRRRRIAARRACSRTALPMLLERKKIAPGSHPRGDLHQQGRRRNEDAPRAHGRCSGARSVGRHVPCDVRAHVAPRRQQDRHSRAASRSWTTPTSARSSATFSTISTIDERQLAPGASLREIRKAKNNLWSPDKLRGAAPSFHRRAIRARSTASTSAVCANRTASISTT